MVFNKHPSHFSAGGLKTTPFETLPIVYVLTIVGHLPVTGNS